MNGRSSGIFKFFVFLFLLVIVLVQVLSMIQANRLYDKLDRLTRNLERTISSRPTARQGEINEDLPGEPYPGDDGDWLVWCINAEPANLNPITRKDTYAAWILSDYGNIFESMLQYDLDKIEVEPFLAKSYEISEDGLELTFHLRDDVRFSDGKKLTSADVAFTYETIVDPNVDAHSLANYFKDVNKVVVIDEHTIKFMMKRRYFKSLVMIGGMPIMPQHIYQFK